MTRDVLNLTGPDTSWKDGPKAPPVLPKGSYRVSIYDAEQKYTKNGDNPYLSLTLKVLDEGEFFETVVFDNFVAKYRTEKAPFMVDKAKQLARISGLWDGVDPKPGEQKQIHLPAPEDVIGLEIDVYVGQETDKWATERYEEEHGKEPDEPIIRNRFTRYQPPGGWSDDGAKTKTKSKKAISI